MKFIVLLFLIIIVSCGTKNTNSEIDSRPINTRTRIESELKSLNAPFNNSKFQKDISTLKSEVSIFFNWAILIEEAFNNADPEIVKLGRLLSEKVEEIQIKEFPILRVRYSALLVNKLSRYSAKVRCVGAACESFLFTSKEFNSWDVTARQVRNRNNFQKSIKEDLRLFRFKRVSYQEKEGALNSAGFSLKCLEDNEIAVLGSSLKATFQTPKIEPQVAEIKSKIEAELSSLSKPFDNSQYGEDIASLKLEVATFFNWTTLVDQALNSEDNEIIQRGGLLSKKVAEIQMREFPGIRNTYAKLVINKLLRYGANVKCIDQNCQSLLIISKDFNAVSQVNVNKRATCQKSIEEELKLFRFKLVKYAEIESALHALQVPMQSLDDDEISVVNSSPEATYLEHL